MSIRYSTYPYRDSNFRINSIGYLEIRYYTVFMFHIYASETFSIEIWL